MRFRAGVLGALASMAVTLGAGSAAVGVEPSEAATANRVETKVTDCQVDVIGTNPDGSWRLSPMVCERVSQVQRDAQSLSSSVLARHYSGFNWTGNSLTINGAACSGGWLNMSAAWNDKVLSTRSSCMAVRHYRDFYLSGPNEVTSDPGGNLSTLAWHVSSVSYN